jgi:hypothetical protein
MHIILDAKVILLGKHLIWNGAPHTYAAAAAAAMMIINHFSTRPFY